ncbi:hypothetical protein GFS31_06780 [Leptolyngbya sp. BL0902]|uniref:hypothetical protein n=1 Tax=Leptolyngbya sp. BL0902 TaxID=1115757 RepID=UPI0018E6E876|nr:hypothetical protein [Leptolyngbya sp. BL0902]QQE64006.1 hypothetical protein GFS31_06780 [Leptolyngbya sp. BL0902]
MKLLKGLPINLAALKPNPAALKGIPAVLRQPQWIAAIASVGFHGALFAVGPSFANLQSMAMGAPGNREAERRVPIIELSAEEQSRLPDFNSPAYSFQPGDGLPGDFPSGDFSAGRDLNDLFPPVTSRATPLPPLPGGLSSLPRIPSSGLGAPLTVSPFPSRLGSRSPIVIPNTPGNRPNLPIPTDLAEDEEASPSEETAASTPTSQNGRENPAPRAEEPSRPRNGEVAASSGDAASRSPRQEAADLGPSQSARDLIARVEYSPTLTTTTEAETALTAWRRTVAEVLGEPPTLAEETFSLEVPYDLRICLQPEPSDGMLGFVLLPGEDADTLNISTTVLKSTGYPFLNQAAAQNLQTLAANSETPLAPGTLYRAVVRVLYSDDDCIATDTLLKRAEDEAPQSPAPQRSPAEPALEDTSED